MIKSNVNAETPPPSDMAQKAKIYHWYSASRYPSRDLDESAKKCRRCGSEQSRRIDVDGPFDLMDCRTVPVKHPRRSHWLLWKILLVAWFVSPPDYSDSSGWFVIKETGICSSSKCRDDHAGEEHNEKAFRRKFSRLSILVLRIKSRLYPNHYSFKA